MRNGFIYSGIGEEYRLKSNEVHLTDIDIPNSINWTEKGAVNPPKDQGICGSCWSFATIGSLEGSYFIKNGKLISGPAEPVRQLLHHLSSIFIAFIEVPMYFLLMIFALNKRKKSLVESR